MAVDFPEAGWELVGAEARAGVALVHFSYCCLAAAVLCSEQRCWRS